jgi:RNA polymerase sigma-70 factor (ECF subfamily)
MSEIAASDFASLIARARLGEEEAIARLVREYEPEVRMAARALLGSALRPLLDSLDLVQSVHQSLIVGLRNDKYQLTRPEQLLGLALTLVRRKVARHWRKIQRQQRLQAQAVVSGQWGPLGPRAAPEPVDPSQSLQIDDELERLYDRLGPLERRLVELRLQGYSTADVAREIGVDPDVLRVKLSRLRHRLREEGVLNEWI